MRIRTWGALSIDRGGEPVDELASSKVQALPVYLACTGREYPPEVLAEPLWDDRTQRQALANLRVILSSLCQEVAPFVTICRSTADIDGAVNVWLDVVQLERVIEILLEVEIATSAAVVEATEEALRF